jgi:hypothetical protein
MLMLAACSQTQTPSSGGAVSIFEAPDESLGDVKVWMVQNKDTATGYSGTRSRAVEIVLVNESHSQYRGLTSDRLTEAERIVPDLVARRLLQDLAAAGMTKAKSGAIGVGVPPDQYVKGVTKRIHMWIGIEHRLPNGKTAYTFLPRFVMRLEELDAAQEQIQIFNDCQRLVLAASGNSFPKDRSRGTTAADLRDQNPPAGR